KLSARYDDCLKDIELMQPLNDRDVVPNRHLYPIRTSRRDELRTFLKEKGIETLIHYPVALPDQPALKKYVTPGQDFPIARRAAAELVSLPLYPELRDDELDHVIRSIREFFRK